MQDALRFEDVAGVRTAIYDSGPRPGRPTIVMVHGGDPRSLSNALDWSTVWAPDELDARFVAYDKPGQGRSYVPGMAVDAVLLPGLVAHLERLLQTLPAPLVLVGHSRGALPVADLALSRPELLAGLVIVSSNTLAPGSAATPKDFYPRAYADAPAELGEEYLRREPEMNSCSTAHIDRGFLEGRRLAALESGWWEDRAHRTRIYPDVADSLTTGRERVLERLAATGFEMPVLQLWGGADISAPLELAHALFGLISRHPVPATSVAFAGSAHYVYREEPVRFRAQLAAFLAAEIDG